MQHRLAFMTNITMGYWRWVACRAYNLNKLDTFASDKKVFSIHAIRNLPWRIISRADWFSVSFDFDEWIFLQICVHTKFVFGKYLRAYLIRFLNGTCTS